MGTRIQSYDIIKPIRDGFRNYIREIIDLTHQRNISWDYNSFSPSQIAVNRQYTDVMELRNWLSEKLNLI